ncbi:type II toxin-antitoxin system prevent-host-death family antitoxin [Sphingomonas oligophenolica]|uniref:Antitoxin n=2 Tax=Sphingomonas oligophenolica TaxID=301154 RepID=A0ABU9Y051_9SPHN
MREIQSSEAKAHLTQLLTAVERGESFTITRHGQPVAQLVPVADRRKAEVERVMEQIAAFRETMPRLTVDELLAARHEGHRH